MRIVIVEDHLMFREVLRKVCVEELRHDVVAEVADGERGVAAVALMKPDLVLLDLHLPGLDGFGVVERIRGLRLSPKILVLSSHCDEFSVFRVERSRVQGFVDKNTNSVAALKAAITAVEQGLVWFSETFQRVKAARLRNPRAFDKLLTKRERAVLLLVGLPLEDVEIAERLRISAETVEKHRSNIRRKLALNSTAELTRYAREHGFTLAQPMPGDPPLLP